MWILLLFLGNARSQKLVVDDFSMSFNDLTPSIQNVKDLNDVPCALIKIWLVDEITRVEGIYVGKLVDRVCITLGMGWKKIIKRLQGCLKFLLKEDIIERSIILLYATKMV